MKTDSEMFDEKFGITACVKCGSELISEEAQFWYLCDACLALPVGKLGIDAVIKSFTLK